MAIGACPHGTWNLITFLWLVALVSCHFSAINQSPCGQGLGLNHCVHPQSCVPARRSAHSEWAAVDSGDYEALWEAQGGLEGWQETDQSWRLREGDICALRQIPELQELGASDRKRS